MDALNKVKGKKVKDIGRLLNPDQYEKNYDFNDYKGACYMEIGDHGFVIQPSGPGESMTVTDEEKYEMGDQGKYSFKKFYKGVIGQELKMVQPNGNKKLSFDLIDGSFSLELKESDRIGINVD